MTLTSLAAVSCTVESVRKKLPASSMTVGKLKQMCKRLFKVDTDQQVDGCSWISMGVLCWLLLGLRSDLHIFTLLSFDVGAVPPRIDELTLGVRVSSFVIVRVAPELNAPLFAFSSLVMFMFKILKSSSAMNPSRAIVAIVSMT